jgi:hypothetical protein
MEIDQERRHRVEQAVAVWPGPEREAHQEPAILDRVAEIFRGQDRLVADGLLREADRGDGREAGDLEAAQDIELRLRDGPRFLLEREGPAVEDDEPNEVARWPDGQIAKRVRLGGPGGQRRFPGKLEQARPDRTEAEPREAAPSGLGGQSFLRRYAVTDAS